MKKILAITLLTLSASQAFAFTCTCSNDGTTASGIFALGMKTAHESNGHTVSCHNDGDSIDDGEDFFVSSSLVDSEIKN